MKAEQLERLGRQIAEAFGRDAEVGLAVRTAGPVQSVAIGCGRDANDAVMAEADTFTEAADNLAAFLNAQGWNGDEAPGLLTINGLMRQAHETAVEKGWYRDGDRNIGEVIALMHSELSEALEDWRLGQRLDMIYHHRPERTAGPDDCKPEGFAVELADVLIRIADTCQHHGIDLESALYAKLAYNRTRPYRHGGKVA